MKQKRHPQQLHFPGFTRTTREQAHGGENAVGKRKGRRPFDSKQALHVVLRSSKARGKFSMLLPQHCNPIRALVDRLKKQWGISVYRFANVGNHLHLLIRAKSRSDWQGFIRELSGGIAMLVTGARKGHSLLRSKASGPETTKRGFWDHLVFTRIVSWGRDFHHVARYVLTNLWEGAGVPVRKLLEGGYKVLDLSEEGGILVHTRINPDLLALIKAQIAPA